MEFELQVNSTWHRGKVFACFFEVPILGNHIQVLGGFCNSFNIINHSKLGMDVTITTRIGAGQAPAHPLTKSHSKVGAILLAERNYLFESFTFIYSSNPKQFSIHLRNFCI